MPDSIDTDDLRSDANDYWKPWHETVLGYGASLTQASSQVTEADWSRIPGAQDVRAAFGVLLDDVAQFYTDGSEVLEGVARKLLATAQSALEREHASRDQIEQVIKEIEAL
ncbi:hypothetical protein [Cellulomonas citrea]|uniref:hypothetical protein n=1 Tax=Cellulomonas citrea TaxID=1909423 RepID=UPI00135CC98B|nr:hypothetical protein [Cellulomonas citrea]